MERIVAVHRRRTAMGLWSCCRSIRDFALVKEIGSGAVSSVWYAFCRKSTLRVAIKIYDKTKLTKLNQRQVRGRPAMQHSACELHVRQQHTQRTHDTHNPQRTKPHARNIQHSQQHTPSPPYPCHHPGHPLTQPRTSLLTPHHSQVQREIQIHSSLSHPHIVEFFAAFEDAQGVYLLLEYAEGGDLFDVVKRRGGRMTEAALVKQVR
jgi:serine/threonine protein kinase